MISKMSFDFFSGGACRRPAQTESAHIGLVITKIKALSVSSLVWR
jgi:hypothetical protein